MITVTMNEVVIFSCLLLSVMSSPLVDGTSAQHKRVKRWQRYGNKVWKEPVKIGFKNYTNIYSQQDQDQILKECINMWTWPGHLEFQVIKPTQQNPAHITISYQKINDGANDGSWWTLAYSYAPQPQSPQGTRIVLGNYKPDLRLRKYGETGSSFKLILCHEIGHALGVDDSYDKRTIMYVSATGSEVADDVLDWDSRNAIRWLYYIPYPTTTTTTTTRSQTTTSETITEKPTRVTPKTKEDINSSGSTFKIPIFGFSSIASLVVIIYSFLIF